APALALASRMACRSEPAPLSLVLSTVKVLGRLRPSRTSHRGRYDGRRDVRRSTRDRFDQSCRSQRRHTLRDMIQSFRVKAGWFRGAEALTSTPGTGWVRCSEG